MKTYFTAAALVAFLLGSTMAFAAPGPQMLSGGGAGPGTELKLPPVPPPAPSSSSGAWVRPYTQGDGGVGAMGGYTSPNTSVRGDIYVPHYGSPGGGVQFETHF